MRLLVTNAHAPQAYAIVRALRPHAEFVAATIEGDGWRASLAHGARSRLVDAVRRIPSAVDDWSSGRAGLEATPAEEAVVASLLDICARDRIDAVFPSWDPYVSVVSRHKARFEALGVTVPVPDFETVLTALDKYRSVQAAESVGMPCPRTCLYESHAQALDVAAAFGYPIVIKPRFTSGGHGMAIPRDRAELDRVLPSIVTRYGGPLIQEYIPGGQRDSIQFVVDRQGAPVFVFHKKRRRTFRRTARFGTVSESAVPDDRVRVTAALVGKVGWWGAMGIETIRDPRDGLDKLMEINPRFPRQLWNRTELGINEPLMCLQIARGQTVAPVACPPGVLFVCPVEDVMLLGLQVIDRAVYAWRTGIGGQPLIDASTAPPPLTTQVREFVSSYAASKPRVWDPYVRHFLHDPLAAAMWWMQFSTWIAGSWRQLGR